jgi:hypothetical protein
MYRFFQLEPVVAIGGIGLVGKSGFMQDGEHELAGSIAGEGASSAVGAVRTGGQAQDEHSRIGIAEAGHRFAPIFAVAVSPAFLAGHLFAIRNQPRTAGASDDFVVRTVSQRGIAVVVSLSCVVVVQLIADLAIIRINTAIRRAQVARLYGNWSHICALAYGINGMALRGIAD